MSDAVPTAPTSLVELIDRLVDPPVPDPIPLTPQTAGWWVLGALLLIALAYGGWRFWQRWRANAYRRAAIKELDAVGEDAAAVAAILRRAALAAFPRGGVASLTGEDWVTFLRTTGKFPSDAGPALIRAPYAPDTDASGSGALCRAARSWVQTHRRAQ